MNPRVREYKLDEYKGCEITVWSGVKDTGWPFSDGLVVCSDGSRHPIEQIRMDKVLLSKSLTEEVACKQLVSRIEENAKALIDSLTTGL